MLRIIRRITPYAHARSKETPQGKVQGGERDGKGEKKRRREGEREREGDGERERW